MKKKVVEFVARCLVCQTVKEEHKTPQGEVQSLVYLSGSGRAFLWISLRDTWSKAELAKAYVKNVVKLHGIAIFDGDSVDDEHNISSSYRWADIENYSNIGGYDEGLCDGVWWIAGGEDDRVDAIVLGPEMIQEMVEQVHIIRQKMRAAHDRQKSYADLKMSDRVGEVAYRLALPPALDRVHNVFHVSQLTKYVSDPTHVLEPEHIEIDDQLSYVEEPKEILDRKVRKARNGETALVKVLRSNHKVEEATWEAEVAMRDKYPSLFVYDIEIQVWGSTLK
ncbi:uncharacterized protein LOC141588278 [Silene latifolia]|uniref:uncharacterized protein LOC141588278 n=1 Tax=Silene latifolia TaxID=37657 RepID=UPI003D78A5D3